MGSPIEFVFTEMSDKNSEVFKRIEVLTDGSIKKTAQATITRGVARTRKMKPEEFVKFLDEMNFRPDTCIVPAIWPGGENWKEFDICLKGKEDPDSGIISRSIKFFKYANNDTVSLMCFDLDGDYTKEQAHEFIEKLENILADAIISAPGNKGKIMRFEKPSSSAGVKINGKVGTGLHIYFPVKNAQAGLLKDIFRWAWLKQWPGHMISDDASVLDRSIIDESVGTPGRLFFEANAEVTGCLDLVEIVDRNCSYYPGGIIDCEIARGILSDLIVKYPIKWSAYKRDILASKEYQDRYKEIYDGQKAKHIGAGRKPRDADFRTKLLLEDRTILSSEFLTRSDGELVSVYDLLVNRDDWIDEPDAKNWQDFIKPKAGTNKAMLLIDPDTLRLRSFAHGIVYYWLKFDYDGLLRWTNEATDDELGECFGSFAAQSVMPQIKLDEIINEVKKKLKTTTTAIRKDITKSESTIRITQRHAESESGESGEVPCLVPQKASHNVISEDMLNVLGRCRAYGDTFYVADKSFWKAIRPELIQEMFAVRYDHCDRCKTGPDYRNIANLTFGKERAYCRDWETPFGIPCNSKFIQVGPDCSMEVDGKTVTGVKEIPYHLDLGCRFKLNFNPDPECETPYWNMVLNNVVNKRCFQQGFGLALSGYLTIGAQMAMVLKGVGGTGKGTTNRVLTAMLPQQCVTAVSFEQMSHRTDCMPLVNSVINIIPEMNKTSKAQITEGFKKATGKDLMQGHRMYKGEVKFTSRASQIINFNEWPTLDSIDRSIERRLGECIVEFQHNQEEKIDDLEEKIISRELPGVLAWAIAGIQDYFENGPDKEHSLALFRSWTRSFDPIALFVDECCIVGKGVGQTGTTGLYEVFKQFCDDSGYFQIKKGALISTLVNNHKCKETKSDLVCIDGVVLNTVGEMLAKKAGIKVLKGKAHHSK